MVEGETEVRFIKHVLSPYLFKFNIDAQPFQLITNRQTGSRGGTGSYKQFKSSLNNKMKNDSSAYFSMFFDYYGLNNSYPLMNEVRASVDTHIDDIESRIGGEVENSRFIPYIQKHEFEALLFSDSHIVSDKLSIYNSKIEGELLKVCKQYPNPEDINEGKSTAPSKRLINLTNNKYSKTSDGIILANEIGIDAILSKCPRFAGWVQKLRDLPPIK